MEQLSHRKRVRDDSAEFEFNNELVFDFDIDTPKVKKIRDDLLSLLDDSEPVPDRDSDLDSVIRSFEAEISGSGLQNQHAVVDLTSDSGGSQPEIGGEGNELGRVGSESSGLGELWEFQDELPSYDSVGFGSGFYEENTGMGTGKGENNNEFVALDGIFDYSDVNFGSDLWWPPETLPAL